MQNSNQKYFVYAISSEVRNYIYVGMTNNLERRISDHNYGYNKTTKPYIPFKVIYTEEFDSRIVARQKEKYLKSGVGKEFLKSL
jgi:putative endonuclease